MEFIGKVDIKSLIDEYGTPLYVYDQKIIETNYKKIFYAFSKFFENFKIHYSVKANSNLQILRLIKSLGAGVDCSSPFELRLALLAGFKPDVIVYTGNYESIDDLKYVSSCKVRINLDDISSYNRLIKVCSPDFASFRVNPGIGKGGFEGITTGGADAKFGVPYELLKQAYFAAKKDGVKRFGVHIMTGSNILEPYYFAEVLEKLMRISGRIFSDLEIKPEYIDIGGGFGIPYSDEDVELDIETTARLISEVFFEYCDKFDLGKPELKIEPGRYLIGNAGYVVSRVTGIKRGYKKFVGLDAGMNVLIRPALYGATHRIKIYGRDGVVQMAQICGQICENSDILGKNVPLPEVEEGDIVIILDAGAYGFSMASNYNGRPLPAEVLVDGDSVKLIRKRQSFEDYVKLMEFEKSD